MEVTSRTGGWQEGRSQGIFPFMLSLDLPLDPPLWKTSSPSIALAPFRQPPLGFWHLLGEASLGHKSRGAINQTKKVGKKTVSGGVEEGEQF